MKRPLSAEHLSIQQMMEHFNWVNGHWVAQREKTQVIICTYPHFSLNSEDPNYEEYCWIKILLHHPFWDLHAILWHDNGDNLWHELYAIVEWRKMAISIQRTPWDHRMMSNGVQLSMMKMKMTMSSITMWKKWKRRIGNFTCDFTLMEICLSMALMILAKGVIGCQEL